MYNVLTNARQSLKSYKPYSRFTHAESAKFEDERDPVEAFNKTRHLQSKLKLYYDYNGAKTFANRPESGERKKLN